MNRQQLFVTVIAIILSANVSFAAEKSDQNPSFISGVPDQATMLAVPTALNDTHHTYILPATRTTTQWGVFDNSQPPVLSIKSGDHVVIETMAASDNQVVPGSTIDQIIQIQGAVKDRGPHTLTGPIYVEGAEPGDVLRIHFNKIVPRAYASNNTMPGKGLFPKDFTDNNVKYFYLDVAKKEMQFAPNIIVPLNPFPGVVGVAQAAPGKFSSGPPGQFGGNMDLREMVEGTTLYLPVFVKGALLWTGDSHAGQGNGEIDLTAIETAFNELNVTVDLIKQKPLTWPRVETKSAWIAVGYDEDLNKALDILKTETLQLIADTRHVSMQAAEKIRMQTWNCPIAEVVNGVKGVYCIVPKEATAAKPQALPQQDTPTQFVTYAKDPDIEKAMQNASMAMINKLVSEKQLSRMEAYRLASFTMDCRVAPYVKGDKEVHCLLAKNMWR